MFSACALQTAIREFEFDDAKLRTAADETLSGYFESEYYSKRRYDRRNPVVGSFVGRDCDNKPLKLLFVAYRPSDPAEHLLASVFEVVGADGALELVGEGPGMSRDVEGIIKIFRDPANAARCHKS